MNLGDSITVMAYSVKAAEAFALREAQLNMIAMKQYKSPYYWAGFRLFGKI